MSGSPTFFFNASEAKAGDIAVAISDFYAVSVLVQGADHAVSGRLVAHSLAEALDAFAFLLGVPYRADKARNAYFFGGKTEEVVTQLPSYGLNGSELSAALKENVSVVGDRIIVRADETKTAQIREALSAFTNRETLNLEIIMVDVSTNTVDRVNAWLDSFNVGFGYISQSANALAQTFTPAATAAAAVSPSGWYRDIELKSLFALLDTDSSAVLELREQAQILSGSQTVFSSGQVVETPLIVREPETGKDLVTRIERRTVGLQLHVRATSLGEQWHVEFDLEDGNLVAGKEQTTHFTGQRRLDVTKRFALLASFTRRGNELARREVPGFSKIPMVGKAFRKSTGARAIRSVMILARATPVHLTQPPQFPLGGLNRD